MSGDFTKVWNKIKIFRPIENSPNPITEFYKENCIEFNTFNSEYDIDNHGLNPSRDMLVINLKESYSSKSLQRELEKKLNEKCINF